MTASRGSLHASQKRALATLFHVQFEQSQGMCCFFAASCALNIIGIVAPGVSRTASERDFASLTPAAYISERDTTFRVDVN